MPPLTWRNVDDPDLTKASDIMTDALARIGEGTTGISETLSGVMDRRRRDASAALVPMLAGIQNSGQVDAVLNRIASTVDPTLLTPEMQAQLLAQRGQTAAVDGTRASTAATLGAENRNQTRFGRQIERENQLATLTGEVARGQEAAFGSTGSLAPASLVRTESGGNWRAQNNEVGSSNRPGHYGRLQFGHDRLDEARAAGVMPANMTPEEFMNSPETQVAVENWHFAEIDRNLSDLVGRTVNGVVMTPDAIRAVAHLGGQAGARRFVESNGQYDPTDSLGTSLAEYAQTHSGGGINLSQFIPAEGNMLLPEDILSLYQNQYDDERQVFGDRTADAESAQARQDAEIADQQAQAATGLAEQIINGLGPTDTLQQFTNALFNTPNLDPAVRDAALAYGKQQIENRAPLYEQLGDPTPEEADMAKRVDLALENKTISDTENDPTTENLRAIGYFEMAQNAQPDSAETLAAANESLLARMSELSGGDEDLVQTSAALIQDRVDAAHEELGGTVPKNMIYRAVEHALRGDRTSIANPLEWIGLNASGGLYLDKDALVDIFRPVSTEEGRRQVLNDENLRRADSENVENLKAAFIEAQREANFWDRSNNPEGDAKAEEARTRMTQILENIENLPGAKVDVPEAAGEGGGDRNEGGTPDRNDAGDLAAASSSERRQAILSGTQPFSALQEALGTPERARTTEMNQAIGNMSLELSRLGGNQVTSAINRAIDFVTQDRATGERNSAFYDKAAAAREWINSPAARELLEGNPEMVEEALSDPLAFYEKHGKK